jgi:hypothetical protein
VRSELRYPMELHEPSYTFLVNEREGMHAKSLHHAVTAWNGSVGQCPHNHVYGLWHKRYLSQVKEQKGVKKKEGEVGYKVPKIVVCCRSLGHFIVWLWFSGVNDVREFDRILNKEDWNIVAD